MTTFAFIDAANIFYESGRSGLLWTVDCHALIKYLKERYGVERVYFFGGLETYGFSFNPVTTDALPLLELQVYLEELSERGRELTKRDRIALFDYPLRSLTATVNRIKFYRKLEEYGYELKVKPIKTYYNGDEAPRKKRNCDVDMAFLMMREQPHFSRCLILSGDGDFLPVLKYLKEIGKEVMVLARGLKTASEIKSFAGKKFVEFDHLKGLLEQKNSGLGFDDGR